MRDDRKEKLMQLNLLKAEMTKQGVKAKGLSTLLNVPKAGIYRRLNGTTRFSIEEINAIRIKLKLSADDTVSIFFD